MIAVMTMGEEDLVPGFLRPTFTCFARVAACCYAIIAYGVPDELAVLAVGPAADRCAANARA
jgi:hypothetical protein